MSTNQPTRWIVFLMLAAAMLATRQFHFGVLPDASWAVFFLGGFYLNSARVFATFMVGAVAMDYIATQHLGISSYCLSPAYIFLLPSYAALWLGGRWARHFGDAAQPRSLVRLGASLVLSVSACFVVSNGSFYWLSGRVTAPSLAGWLANFRDWYPYFLAVSCVYVGLALLADAIGVRWAHRLHATTNRVHHR